MLSYPWHLFFVCKGWGTACGLGSLRPFFPLRNNRKLLSSGSPSCLTNCSKQDKAPPKHQMLGRELLSFEKYILEKEQQDKAYMLFKMVPKNLINFRLWNYLSGHDFFHPQRTRNTILHWKTTCFVLLANKYIKRQTLSHDPGEIWVCCIIAPAIL